MVSTFQQICSSCWAMHHRSPIAKSRSPRLIKGWTLASCGLRGGGCLVCCLSILFNVDSAIHPPPNCSVVVVVRQIGHLIDKTSLCSTKTASARQKQPLLDKLHSTKPTSSTNTHRCNLSLDIRLCGLRCYLTMTTKTLQLGASVRHFPTFRLGTLALLELGRAAKRARCTTCSCARTYSLLSSSFFQAAVLCSAIKLEEEPQTPTGERFSTETSMDGLLGRPI